MVTPSEHDRRHDDVHASRILEREDRRDEDSTWAIAGLGEVQRALTTTGYPAERVHLVPGKVEDTIPGAAPDEIALLRLDTDWYESTHHELVHLFPRLVGGGVLIIDDYGYWQGARKAVDEYFAEHDVPLLLNRIDATGRVAVVPTSR
jgi:O-methyltransferase